jgi:hypothetical protein
MRLPERHHVAGDGALAWASPSCGFAQLTSKLLGDPDHLKVFANADAAEAGFAENDPKGVAFEYEVIEPPVQTGAPYFSELCLRCWTYSSAKSKSLREVAGSVI